MMKSLKSETENFEPKHATWNNLNILLYFSPKIWPIFPGTNKPISTKQQTTILQKTTPEIRR
jgi:hypothetical protein